MLDLQDSDVPSGGFSKWIAEHPFCARLGVLFIFVVVIGAFAFDYTSLYLGCTGAWSALWPGFGNIASLIFMGTLFLQSNDSKKESVDEKQLENEKKNEKLKKLICFIVPAVIAAIFLTLGLFNVTNLTFALFMAIRLAIFSVSGVLNLYCGNKVENLYPRFMYGSGLIATVTFAFLIAFKVVSLATVVPFVAPSLGFAFLCFVYCVVKRFKKGECGCLIFSVTGSDVPKQNESETRQREDSNSNLRFSEVNNDLQM